MTPRNLVNGTQYSQGLAKVKPRHRSHVIVECVRCMGHKFHEARGLCKCCYNRVREGRVKGQSLSDYPPLGGYGSSAVLSEADAIRKYLDPLQISTEGDDL